MARMHLTLIFFSFLFFFQLKILKAAFIYLFLCHFNVQSFCLLLKGVEFTCLQEFLMQFLN